MPIIDADTHVDETEDTWEYLRPDEQEHKPTTGYPPNPDPSRPPARYWVVDGRRHLRFIRDDVVTRTTAEKRELMDVPGRLADMDAMGVETQVIYPTLFLVEVTERPEVDLALRRSYNRWLGARCDESGGRLRWVCLPPTLNVEQAVEELRWAKDHGAVGVM
jgi:predicted TIM-barrel fold metal-dependent hydrolase